MISAIPQDLKFAGEETIVKIGNNTTIREFVTINRGTKASYETVIGNNCLLMAYVHIAHDCVVGNNAILANAAQLGGHISIDDWAIVGGLVAIHQFVHIGAHSMISGGSLVERTSRPSPRQRANLFPMWGSTPSGFAEGDSPQSSSTRSRISTV